MSDEADKLAAKALGSVMKFIRNEDDYREEFVEIELTDKSQEEIELAFTFGRDRFYLRLRREDVARFMEDQE